MAADEREDVSEQRKSDKKETYDPALDFLSEHFDPLRALTTPGVVPPVPDATTYTNIAKYEYVQSNLDSKPVPKAGSSKAAPKDPSTFERRWLPHQLPVQVDRSSRQKNIFTKLEAMKGPLSLLKKCKDDRLRIKVWTRHSHDIRGYCEAFVTLFDKHWNLVLEDVTEVWTRPKRRKVPAGLDTIEKYRQKERIKPPAVTVIKSDKKTETCQRHVDQLLVRGEQIALIALLSQS